LSSEDHDNSDQKNIDLILLTIGVLIGVAVVIFIIARDLSNEAMARMQMDDPAVQAVIDERIQPFGKVYTDGQTIPVDPAVQQVAAAQAAAAPLTGPQVYNAACLACHGGGIAGAPKTGDAAAWGPRIAQGMDTLNKHALEGFTGAAGVMPAKGGRADLSDAEITDAVAYLVEQVK
jgi:cytochrome c5